MNTRVALMRIAAKNEKNEGRGERANAERTTRDARETLVTAESARRTSVQK